MRILVIHNLYRFRGGEDAYFNSLINLLKSKGQTVEAFTKDGRDIKEDVAAKFDTAFGMFSNQKIEKELSAVIQEFKPNVVHINNIFPLITPVVYHVCKKFHLPIVQTIHNYRFLCPKSFLFRDGRICELCAKKKFAYPSILYKCYHESSFASLVFSSSFSYHKLIHSFDPIDKYIFPSEFAKQCHLKYLPIPPEKTAVIPYFVQNRETSEPVKKENYFLFVGRLSEEKGILTLLDIVSTIPFIRLVIIGDGPLRKEVMSYKKYRNICYKNFLPREEIYEYMKKALCTIIPSKWYETGPIVLMESFANGTPVLVSDIGTFKERVKEGRTGFFFSLNNLVDFREKLSYLWNHKTMLNNMSKTVRREYETNYTEENHYRKLMNLYKSLGRIR